MKTKILFILFLVRNRALLRYLESLHNLHMSIFDVWRCYSASSWIKPCTFEYFNKYYFKNLDEIWRSEILKEK